ncbi:MAG: hydantoinase B/oxoprolinase family protein, partial [Burkholderiaceae bacterium]|nr:hydantoinase B/oxoprolinase family protein [Burkholderiaceae bacterium]
GLADQAVLREATVESPLLPQTMPQVEARLAVLAEAASAELVAQGVPRERIRLQRRVHLKYEGTDTALPVHFDALPAMVAQFEAAYTARFSFLMRERRLVVETVAVEASGGGEAIDAGRDGGLASGGSPAPATFVQAYFDSQWQRTPLYLRGRLRGGDAIDGPAIVAEENATTVIEPGWRAQITPAGGLVMRRVTARPARRSVGTQADAVMLEVFNNLFMSIAEQMGVRLQNTAYSVNIKERLDFSCAVFDAEGNLIANAPHMPVHLGSMSESIKTVMRANAGRMKPGDAYVVNDPYHGGTHLPDVTVITPVFDRAGREIL